MQAPIPLSVPLPRAVSREKVFDKNMYVFAQNQSISKNINYLINILYNGAWDLGYTFIDEDEKIIFAIFIWFRSDKNEEKYSIFHT